MGIKGLLYFVDKYKDTFLREKELKDTTLIIDGINIMYIICRQVEREIQPKYGGNYHAYRSAMDEFFQNLKECNIIPIVILDGCKREDNPRLTTRAYRQRQKIKNSIKGSKNQSQNENSYALPLLMRQEFKTSLIRNEIVHMTTKYNAYESIVKLANYYNGYVLANNTDYFIPYLSKGVVVFDHLNLQPMTNKRNNEKFMKARVFHKEIWLNHFDNLDTSLIALGGALHGHDDFFIKDSLISELWSDRDPEIPFDIKEEDKKYKTMLIFSWLNDIGLYDEALGQIKKVFSPIGVYFWKSFEKCIKKYKDNKLPSFFTLQDDLSNYKDRAPIKTKNGRNFPGWVLKRLQMTKFDPNLLNFLITCRIFLPMQVEDFNAESSHQILLPIRQIIYDILSKYDECQEHFIVEEYDRQGEEQHIFQRKPRDCPVGVDLNTINKLSKESRKDIFRTIVDVEFNEELIDENIRGIFYCIVFWIKESTPKISNLYVNALFFSIIKCYYIDKDLVRSSNLRKRLLEYEKNESDADSFKVEIIHSFGQFQSVYLTFTWLNDLLHRPIYLLDPSYVFSGSLIYNLYLAFEDDENLFNCLLEEDKELDYIFQKFSLAITSADIQQVL